MHTKKRRESISIQEVFPGSPFCLAKRWKFFFFDVRKVYGRRPARQPSTVVLEGRPQSIFVDLKDLLPDAAVMNL